MKISSFAAAVSALALLQSFAFSEEAPAVKMSRPNDSTISFEGGTYRALAAISNASVDFELRTSRGFIPAISGCRLITWGDNWKRLFDNNSPDTKCESSVKDGKPVLIIRGKSEFFESVSEYSFSPETIEVTCTLKCTKDLDKLRRVSLEIDPVWKGVAGAGLSTESNDGRKTSQKLPSVETANGKYEILFGGNVSKVVVDGLYGCNGAGFEIAGDQIAGLEQTGSQFRWQLGIPESTPDVKVEKGRIFTLKLAFSFKFSSQTVLGTGTANISIDAASSGKTVSPYIFGAQMAHVGHGVKNKGMRGEFDYNPKYDEQARQLLKDSGITFVRIYLHSLYDSYVDKDPICPEDGAACDYTRGDSYMEAMNELGIEVIPCVGL